MAILGRDRRAAAQAMLWGPLHPDPDGLALSVDDRKIVIGVYPIRILTGIVIGVNVGTRGRVAQNRGDSRPRLMGRYIPGIDA